ncbi:MAG TPA: ribosome maturation factor RimP [Candidatus Cloacimonadota bacterium]|nr:ribosome maturation factor RimP [Candidatus Cloacimonadota bacterium]
MHNHVSEQLEEIAKQACSEVGVSLYDLETLMTHKGEVISVQISKIGGVTVDDCTKVNRAMGRKLDEIDLINNKYFLEVSSPGLERPLKFKKHYISAINERIRLLYATENGKVAIDGTLLEVNPETIKVQKEDEVIEIPFSAIKKAKTVFEFGTKKENK